MLLVNYTSYYCFLRIISKTEVTLIPLVILCIIFGWNIIKKKCIKKQVVVIGVVLCVNIILSSVFDGFSFQTEVWMLISAILCAMIVVTIVSRKEIVECYVTVIVALAIYSLLTTYIILPLYMSGKINIFPIVRDAMNRQYLNTYFSMALCTFSIPRNCGFCREPGIYQFFLTIAIFLGIEYQDKSKRNLVEMILLIITLLSTFSAVAYVIALVCVYTLMKKYSYSTKKMMKMTCLMFVIALIIYFIVNSNEKINNEFMRTFGKWSADSNSGSLQVRWSGIVSNLSLFLEKPILGYGLVTSWLEIISRFGYLDVTGTTFIGFAAFGIIFGVVMHFLFFRSCISLNGNTILWIAALMLSSLSQNLIISNIFWIFLFFSYSKKDVEEKVSTVIKKGKQV